MAGVEGKQSVSSSGSGLSGGKVSAKALDFAKTIKADFIALKDAKPLPPNSPIAKLLVATTFRRLAGRAMPDAMPFEKNIGGEVLRGVRWGGDKPGVALYTYEGNALPLVEPNAQAAQQSAANAAKPSSWLG